MLQKPGFLRQSTTEAKLESEDSQELHVVPSSFELCTGQRMHVRKSQGQKQCKGVKGTKLKANRTRNLPIVKIQSGTFHILGAIC
jgi:hypothetical protein